MNAEILLRFRLMRNWKGGCNEYTASFQATGIIPLCEYGAAFLHYCIGMQWLARNKRCRHKKMPAQNMHWLQ